MLPPAGQPGSFHQAANSVDLMVGPVLVYHCCKIGFLSTALEIILFVPPPPFGIFPYSAQDYPEMEQPGAEQEKARTESDSDEDDES